MGLSAVETLEQEHRLISRVVRLLPAVRRSVDAGAVDEQVLSDIAEFFSAYTDGCHHAKEEDLFFPILLQRGVSSKGCPVGTLRLEHQQGRNTVKALNTAVSKHRAGDVKAAGTISAILKDATELYTDHIWREDYLLFPMSGKVLLDTDREVLEKDFAEVQAKFGSAFQDKYEALVEKLEKELADAAGSDGTTEDLSATPRQEECASPMD
jgi:hemerythrin-like domain-containing protein